MNQTPRDDGFYVYLLSLSTTVRNLLITQFIRIEMSSLTYLPVGFWFSDLQSLTLAKHDLFYYHDSIDEAFQFFSFPKLKINNWSYDGLTLSHPTYDAVQKSIHDEAINTCMHQAVISALLFFSSTFCEICLRRCNINSYHVLF